MPSLGEGGGITELESPLRGVGFDFLPRACVPRAGCSQCPVMRADITRDMTRDLTSRVWRELAGVPPSLTLREARLAGGCAGEPGRTSTTVPVCVRCVHDIGGHAQV